MKKQRTITAGTLTELLKARGMTKSTYHSRLKRGWTEQRALNEPVNPMPGRPRNNKHRSTTVLEKSYKSADGPSKPQATVPPELLSLSEQEIREFIGTLMLENVALKKRLNFSNRLSESRRAEVESLTKRS